MVTFGAGVEPRSTVPHVRVFLAQTKGRREKERKRKRKGKEEEGKQKGKGKGMFVSVSEVEKRLSWRFFLGAWVSFGEKTLYRPAMPVTNKKQVFEQRKQIELLDDV